jgi:hypothetical protein
MSRGDKLALMLPHIVGIARYLRPSSPTAKLDNAGLLFLSPFDCVRRVQHSLVVSCVHTTQKRC